MHRLTEWLMDHLVLMVATVLFVVAIIVGVSAYRSGEQFGANISTELASIAITVIVIDQLYQVRSQRTYKQQILEQMGSPVNDAALEAVRLAKKHGWLKDGSLRGVELKDANLAGANLLSSSLADAYLIDGVLVGDEQSFTNLEGANLLRANLEGAFLLGTNLKRAILSNANLEGASLLGANLEGSLLFSTNLKRANLLSSSLAGVSLRNANLAGANLSGTNLEGALLLGANLEGAKYDGKTIWPDGFDYKAEGVINVDETEEEW